MIALFVGFSVVAVAFGEVDPKSKCADSGTCSAAPVAPSLLQRAHQTESLVVEEEQTGRAATKRLRLFTDMRSGVELARASPDQARQTARDEFEAMTQGDGEVSEDDLKKAIESRPANDECFNPEAREYNYTAMITSLDTDSSGTVSTAEFEVYLQTPSFLSAVRNRAFTALSIAACSELTNQAAADVDAQSTEEALRQQAAADFAKADNYTLPRNAKPSLAASHFRELNKGIENEIMQEVQHSTAKVVVAQHPELLTDEEKKLLADIDSNASTSLLELSSTSSSLCALESAQARLKHAIATANIDKHDSGRRAGNPAVQAIASLVDEVWGNTVASEHFSFHRAASPPTCAGVCTEWGETCQDWVDESANKCRGWTESSSKECTGGFADESTRNCNSWVPDWLGGGCDVWHTVTKAVCQGWEWINHRVCDGWDWVASGFCRLSAQICQAFECIIDWEYVHRAFSASSPLGLLEQSKDSMSVDVNGARTASGMKSIEDAVAFLTGGAMFAKETSDSGRFSAFENLRQQLENKVTQAKDYIQNNNIVNFDNIEEVLTQFTDGIHLPQNLQDALLPAFNKAAGQTLPTYKHFPRACVSGYNIQLFKHQTLQQCLEICDSTQGCDAVEFGVNHGGSGYEPGDCQPQSSPIRAQCNGAHNNLDLYVKVQATCGANVNNGGAELSSVHASSSCDCKKQCKATPGCKAFTFSMEKWTAPGRNCWLRKEYGSPINNCGSDCYSGPAEDVEKCRNGKNGQNYCSSWCNTQGKWGCGVASHGPYTCDCAGCNGCQAVGLLQQLQVQSEWKPTFAVHLGVSIALSFGTSAFGIQIGVVGGATQGEWKAGLFYEVFSPGSFETDVGAGIEFHIGFWTDFAHKAGKAVDFGMNLDLGLIAPACTVASFGACAVVSQATIGLHGVHTVPEDSDCGKGGWFDSQASSRNCDEIRWGNYHPAAGFGTSSFAAVILSIGFGQSVSPISGDLGASCTSGTWEGGLPEDTNCFDFSKRNIDAKAWRLSAADVHGGGVAWNVQEIQFIGRKNGAPFDSTMNIQSGCTAVDSAHYPHTYFDADGPFGGWGIWGGRSNSQGFFIGLKCNEVWDIKHVKMKQCSTHRASVVAIERGATGDGDWSLVAQVNVPSQGNHLHHIWAK